MAKMSIAKILHIIKTGILGVLNTPEIQSKMTVFGYTPERIAQGKELLEKAQRMTSTHVGDYSDQYAATETLQKTWSDVYSRYMVTLKVVRVAFKSETDMLARFRATGKRRRSLSGWLADARILYDNMLSNHVALERMSGFGYTIERLQNEQNDVYEIERLHSLRLTEKGEAQQSTVDRDKVFDELCDWYSDFRAVARIALYDTPQLLETLGIIKKYDK
jgi:hypothetical protein